MLDAALDQTKALFALPDAQKRAYAVPAGAGQRGYTAVRARGGQGRGHLAT